MHNITSQAGERLEMVCDAITFQINSVGHRSLLLKKKKKQAHTKQEKQL